MSATLAPAPPYYAYSRAERDEYALGSAIIETAAAADKFRRGIALMLEALDEAPFSLPIPGWDIEEVRRALAEWTLRDGAALAVWTVDQHDAAAREARDLEGV